VAFRPCLSAGLALSIGNTLRKALNKFLLLFQLAYNYSTTLKSVCISGKPVEKPIIFFIAGPGFQNRVLSRECLVYGFGQRSGWPLLIKKAEVGRFACDYYTLDVKKTSSNLRRSPFPAICKRRPGKNPQRHKETLTETAAFYPLCQNEVGGGMLVSMTFSSPYIP